MSVPKHWLLGGWYPQGVIVHQQRLKSIFHQSCSTVKCNGGDISFVKSNLDICRHQTMIWWPQMSYTCSTNTSLVHAICEHYIKDWCWQILQYNTGYVKKINKQKLADNKSSRESLIDWVVFTPSLATDYCKTKLFVYYLFEMFEKMYNLKISLFSYVTCFNIY